MKKRLINNENECVKLLLEETRGRFGYELETVESVLGVEFAMSNGEFVSDYDKIGDTNYDKLEELESLDVDVNKWRKMSEEEHGLPTHFPCVAVFFFEKAFDRCGDTTTQILDFVYLTDFQP